MKKFYILCGLLLASPFLFAQNKMQMVTYFPVPYVAYNDIEVTQFCEVGLLNQCNMVLGPGDPAQNPYTLNVYKSNQTGVSGNKLNTGVLRVKSGTLNLNSEGMDNKITGNTLEAGVGTAGTNSELSFEHQLNIVSTNNVPARSASSVTKAEVKQLKMFPDRIANNLPGCAEGVTWQRVQVGANNTGALDEVFLVCGQPVVNQVCRSAKPSTERTCSTGCGKQTRKVYCNINTGQWDTGVWVGACSNPPKTFRNCVEGCGTQSRSYSCDGTRWVPTQWTGSCWAPYGGGQTRGCSSGCGTETSTSTCSGPSWSGNCWSPYCDKSCGCSQCGSQSCESSCDGGYCSGSCWSPFGGGPESRACGEGGTQSRSCNSTCSGASCGAWGSCNEPPPAVDPTTEPPSECTNTCSGGRVRGAYPGCECTCPSGKEWNGSQCVTPKCTESCSGGRSQKPYPDCSCYCPDGYKWNGSKCEKACRPEIVSVGIAYDYHFNCSEVSSRRETRCHYCGVASYNIGGKMPWVNEGSKCEWHNAYYHGDTYWDGGTHLGKNLPLCYGDHQTLCNNYGCGYMCVVSESGRSGTVGRYKCSNGYHCNMMSGSGRVMRCIK